jgi:hypothetical protein
MRKSTQEPFRHFGYWDFKGQRGFSLPLHRETLKRKMRKSAQEPFRLPRFQKTRGLSLCFQSRSPSMEEAINEY